MTVSIPEIDTPRLVLRAPQMADFEPLCAYFQDPRSRFNGGPKEPVDVWRGLAGIAGQWMLRGHGLWHIALKTDGSYAGFAGIFHPPDWPEPELGYGVLARHEGTGLAFEAVSAARDAAARLFGIVTPPSYIAPDNTRSQALAARMGAVREDDIELRGEVSHLWRHPAPEARP